MSVHNKRLRRRITGIRSEFVAQNSEPVALELTEGSGAFNEGETQARQVQPAPRISAIRSAAGARIEELQEQGSFVEKIETVAVRKRENMYTPFKQPSCCYKKNSRPDLRRKRI